MKEGISVHNEFAQDLEYILIQKLSDELSRLYQDEGEIATADMVRRPLV